MTFENKLAVWFPEVGVVFVEIGRISSKYAKLEVPVKSPAIGQGVDCKKGTDFEAYTKIMSNNVHKRDVPENNNTITSEAMDIAEGFNVVSLSIYLSQNLI